MCLLKLTFHSEKLIWAAGRTLHRLCFLAAEASPKGEEAAEINKASSEPALSLTKDRPAAGKWLWGAELRRNPPFASSQVGT